MVLTKIHCNLTMVTSSKEEIDIRPFVDGNDVYINANRTSGSTAQSLVDNLGRIAFDRIFKGIDDSKGFGETDYAYSINKIYQVKADCDSGITTLKAESGWF